VAGCAALVAMGVVQLMHGDTLSNLVLSLRRYKFLAFPITLTLEISLSLDWLLRKWETIHFDLAQSVLRSWRSLTKFSCGSVIHTLMILAVLTLVANQDFLLQSVRESVLIRTNSGRSQSTSVLMHIESILTPTVLWQKFLVTDQ